MIRRSDGQRDVPVGHKYSNGLQTEPRLDVELDNQLEHVPVLGSGNTA